MRCGKALDLWQALRDEAQSTRGPVATIWDRLRRLFTPAADGRMSRRQLFAWAIGVALMGGFFLYDFAEWEHTGGSRRMNAILLIVYELVGKWGVAAICWIISAVIMRAAFQRRR